MSFVVSKLLFLVLGLIAQADQGCLNRYQQFRKMHPGFAGVPEMVERCKAGALTQEAQDCIYTFLNEGGVFMRQPRKANALCYGAYAEVRSCMADLIRTKSADYIIDAASVCKVKDPHERQCTIDRVKEIAKREGLSGALPLFATWKVCSHTKDATIRRCLFNYYDKKPPFNNPHFSSFDDAVEYCEFIDHPVPEIHQCMQAFFDDKPPFKRGLVKHVDQATWICSIAENDKRECVLNSIRKGEPINVDCLSSYLGYKGEDGACHMRLACLSDLGGCKQSTGPQFSAEIMSTIESICGTTNVKQRLCEMKYFEEHAGSRRNFEKIKLLCLINAKLDIEQRGPNDTNPCPNY